MITKTPSAPPQEIIFLLIAVFGSIINSLLALLFGLMALSAMITDGNGTFPSPIWWAFSFGFLALCGFPSIILGIRALQRKEHIARNARSVSYLLSIPVFLSGLLLGYAAFSVGILPVILGPLSKIIAASAAALFTIQVVRRFGPEFSRRRIWGQFILGLWIVPIFALLSEFMILIPTLLLFGVGAMNSDEGLLLLELLSDPTTSTEAFTQAATGILTQPWVIALVLGFFAVLIPLLEEALKTMVVWPWIMRKRNSAEAFLGGVIGGTGYAVFEAIFLTQAESAWFPTTIGRAGATIMHAFTTGIASWGLAEGVINKRWGRLILGYAIAVLFHGLWNAGAVSITLIELQSFQVTNLPGALEFIQSIIPIVILFLTLIALTGLFRISKRLSQTPSEAEILPIQD